MKLGVAGPLVAALAVALAAFGAWPTRPAFACTPGEDFDPVAESDVTVSGVVLGWAEGGLLPDLGAEAFVKPILVDFQVEEALKGDVPASIRFLDTGSLLNVTSEGGGRLWDGSGDACGAFDADPTGQFAVLGLTRDEDGNLRSSFPQVFFIGERSEFAGFRYDRTVEVLSSFGLQHLPAAGYGTAPPTDGPDYELLAPATLLIAFGLGGLIQLRRTA